MLNRCEFIGRLTKSIDLRFTQGGIPVANYTVAAGESWKDKTTGEKKESVEFVRCVDWRKVCESLPKYIGKGSLVYISGKMQTRKWQKDGVDVYTTEINIKELTFLDSKQSGNTQQPGPGSANQQGQQRNSESYYPEKTTPPPPGGFDDDLDIPF
jgi:single-strand DNA-binding protein